MKQSGKHLEQSGQTLSFSFVCSMSSSRYVCLSLMSHPYKGRRCHLLSQNWRFHLSTLSFQFETVLIYSATQFIRCLFVHSIETFKSTIYHPCNHPRFYKIYYCIQLQFSFIFCCLSYHLPHSLFRLLI